MNLHWASPGTGELHERCLAVRTFPVPHTAENTATLVKEVLKEYDVKEERCIFSVTDNCSVMEACVRDHLKAGSTLRFSCVAHWLQLVISDALKESGAIEAVERVRLYVKVPRRDKRWQQLAEFQKACFEKAGTPNKAPLKLFLDGGVRWSALFLMLDRVADLSSPILSHLGHLAVEGPGDRYEVEDDEDAELPLPSGADMKIVRQLVPLLRPLYDATNVFQADGETAPISVIIPEAIKLLNHLKPGPLTVKAAQWRRRQGQAVMVKPAEEIEPDELAPEVVALRAALLQAMHVRFGSGSALDVKGLVAYYYAATFLDHRKRDLPSIAFAHPSTCDNTRAFIIGLAANYAVWEDALRRARSKRGQQPEEGRVAGAGGGCSALWTGACA